MNTKISLSVFNDRIAPVFDVASQILLVEIGSADIREGSLVTLPKAPVEAKVLRLVELGVNTLICGAISKPMVMLAQSQGIRVHDFISGEARQVLQAFKDGCLHEDEFRMPGCRRRRRCRHGQGRHVLSGTKMGRPGWAG